MTRILGLAILVAGALVATFVFGLLPVAVALPVSESAGVWISVAWILTMTYGGALFLFGGRQ